MILVTVGTEKFPFDRLMLWIQALREQGFLQEEIVIQYGSCTTLPFGVECFSKLPPLQFQQLVKTARLTIGHCGEGTILLLSAISKPYILVPRSHRYREHVDDHQVELAIALEQKKIPIAWSPGDLVRFLASPRWTPLSGLSCELICEDIRQRFC